MKSHIFLVLPLPYISQSLSLSLSHTHFHTQSPLLFPYILTPSIPAPLDTLSAFSHAIIYIYSSHICVGIGRIQRMDPPLVNEASFTASANPSSYSLAGLLSFPTSGGGELGLRMGSLVGVRGEGSLEVSTVTEQSGSRGGAKRRRDFGYSSIDASSKLVSTSSANRDLVNHIFVSVFIHH